MRRHNNRREQRDRPFPHTAAFREPEVTRYHHPIQTSAPCTADISWIRGALTCQAQMLTEILERLRRLENTDE